MWEDDSVVRPIIFAVAAILGMSNIIRLGVGILTGWTSKKWKPFLHHHLWRRCLIKQNLAMVLLGFSPTIGSLIWTIEAWWLRWPLIVVAGIALSGATILGFAVNRQEEKIARWKRIIVGMSAGQRLAKRETGATSVISVLGEPAFISLPITKNGRVVWLYGYDDAGGVVVIDTSGAVASYEQNFRSRKRLWRAADRSSESRRWSRPLDLDDEEESRSFLR
jgi:hypothetical protein